MSSLSTNFRMERLLRDSQRENIQSPPIPAKDVSSSSSSSSASINCTSMMSSFLPHPPPQLPRPSPPHPFPSHQFPSGGAFPFGLLPPPLPLLSSPFPHLHHHHPPLPPPLNSFLASAAAALLQQQYRAALFQHFMANTPIFTPGTGNSVAGAGNDTTTTFGSGGGGGSAGTAAPSTHGGHAFRAPLAGNRPFVAANSVTGNGQTPRGRIKREPARGGANKQKANVATCEICGKSFGRPWLLNGHRRIHDGEKPYRCEWAGCIRAFADRSNYRAHERTHHPEKPHACHNCGKAFKLKSYLAKHVRANACRHHQPLKQQPKEDGPPAE